MLNTYYVQYSVFILNASQYFCDIALIFGPERNHV